jgi:hypothetical protein
MERLIFFNTEHLQEARDFATRTGQADKLESVFARLNQIAENSHAKVWLSPDFVPHSFYFQMYPDTLDTIPNDWQKHRIMNGGVIYHGPLEDGSHPETFAVTLTQEYSWSIHT